MPLSEENLKKLLSLVILGINILERVSYINIIAFQWNYQTVLSKSLHISIFYHIRIEEHCNSELCAFFTVGFIQEENR